MSTHVITMARLGLLGTVSAIALALSPMCGNAATIWQVDTKHSHANFSVEHVFVDEVQGTLPILKGTAEIDDHSHELRRVQAQLDPKGIQTGDATRDHDLQGGDWFDVAHFPQWQFSSDSISADHGSLTISGHLIIHGTSAPIVLQAKEVTNTTMERQYVAEGTVDRHAFGMHVTRMDGLIGDDVHITLDIRLKAQP